MIIIPIKWLFHWEYTQHFQLPTHIFPVPRVFPTHVHRPKGACQGLEQVIHAAVLPLQRLCRRDRYLAGYLIANHIYIYNMIKSLMIHGQIT